MLPNQFNWRLFDFSRTGPKFYLFEVLRRGEGGGGGGLNWSFALLSVSSIDMRIRQTLFESSPCSIWRYVDKKMNSLYTFKVFNSK